MNTLQPIGLQVKQENCKPNKNNLKPNGKSWSQNNLDFWWNFGIRTRCLLATMFCGCEHANRFWTGRRIKSDIPPRWLRFFTCIYDILDNTTFLVSCSKFTISFPVTTLCSHAAIHTLTRQKSGSLWQEWQTRPLCWTMPPTAFL
jgi:hypothetical protein